MKQPPIINYALMNNEQKICIEFKQPYSKNKLELNTKKSRTLVTQKNFVFVSFFCRTSGTQV